MGHERGGQAKSARALQNRLMLSIAGLLSWLIEIILYRIASSSSGEMKKGNVLNRLDLK